MSANPYAMAAAAGLDTIGGYLGSQAASKASSAETKAANRAASLQYQQYLQALQYQQPYRYIGNQALNVLAMTYGLDPYTNQTIANPVPTVDTLDPKLQAAYNKIQSVVGPNGDASALSPKYQAVLNQISSKLGYNPLQGPPAGPTTASGAPSYGGSYNVANPLATGGKGAVGSPSSLGIMTDPTAPAPTAGTYNYFFASPDYQFRLNQQQQAIDRANAAKGMVLSGAQQKATAQYSGNLASGEYSNWYNHMANLAGIGQTATNQVQNAGTTMASNAGNAIQAAGDARASGYLGQANSWGNALSGIGNTLATYYAPKPSYVNPSAIYTSQPYYGQIA